jgi:hypothetical protein
VTSSGLNPLFHRDDHVSSGVTCSKISERFRRLTERVAFINNWYDL